MPPVLASCFALSTCLANASPSIEDMSLEEKIGQLFMVCFKGAEVNENCRVLIEEIGVGGVIYYTWANDLSSPSQVSKLSSGLQKMAKIPLFIATDQEGGLVERMQMGFTRFPGNKALAMANDLSLVRESAFVIGQELKAVGVNFNLAPVADVNNNPRNPIIGIRSFGEDALTVSSFVEKALEGYQAAHTITALKHFPGHGDVEVDSHLDLPVLNKSRNELDKIELLPFAKTAALADTVMTAHLMVPSIDPIHCATTSKLILDILRRDIGFKGVIITDSLTMQGVLKNEGSLEEAALRSLEAGCDILLFGGKLLIGTSENAEISLEKVQSVHKFLAEAVKKGALPESRIDEAVSRVLQLKNKYHLLEEKSSQSLSNSALLAKKIASLALKSVQNTPVSLEGKKITFVASSLIRPALNQTIPSHFSNADPIFFTGLSPKEDEIKQALRLAKDSDAIVFFSYNAWKNDTQANLIKELSSLKKPFILVPVRDALDETVYPKADLILKTFSPSIPSLEAACEALFALR